MPDRHSIDRRLFLRCMSAATLSPLTLHAQQSGVPKVGFLNIAMEYVAYESP